MRAVLVLVVMLAWAACLVGAVGLTANLAMTAARTLGQRHGGADRRPAPAPPPRAVVMALVLFAVVMAAAAAVLAGVVVWGRAPGRLTSALAWAALPLWTALCAALTAALLERRRRAPADERHRASPS